MKLFKTQKKNAEKNQTQELYPKVKTYSKAYDFAPQKKEASPVPSDDTPYFALDERPYPTVNLPKIPRKPSDFNDPERIDLQDTLLTDESFVERPLKPYSAVSHASSADSSAKPDEPEEKAAIYESDNSNELEEFGESEESFFPDKEKVPETPASEEAPVAEDTEEEDFWESGEPEKPEMAEETVEDDSTESFFRFEAVDGDNPDSAYTSESGSKMNLPDVSDPEAEYEADSFFESEEDTGLEPDPFSGTDTISIPEPDKEPEEETFEPFSWFDSDAGEEPEDSAGFSFTKKKYTAVIGKKKNLRKKLRSKPKGSLKWKSSDTKIAKVSKKGILKPKKKGKVTIRVKAKGGECAKVKIRVRSSAKKPKTMPWESVGTEKKAVTDKKWARFA